MTCILPYPISIALTSMLARAGVPFGTDGSINAECGQTVIKDISMGHAGLTLLEFQQVLALCGSGSILTRGN